MYTPFALALLIVFGAPQARHPSTAEMQLKKMRVNDAELAYAEDGKGETVVFVHGGGVSDWRAWEGVRPVIADRYRYVSLSRRYHHPNPWTDGGEKNTMAQHVEDVVAFIRGLNAGKVHLVGNSYGGAIAARVALKYPELLSSVIFGEGLIAPVSDEGKAAAAAAQEYAARIQAAARAGDFRLAAKLQYDDVVAEGGAFDKLPPERQQQMAYNAKTLAGEQRAPGPLTCEQLRALSVPSLLVRGEKTGAVSRHRYEMTLTCLPQTAETAIIPGAPHAWQMVNPQASASVILTFLAKHDRSSDLNDRHVKLLHVNGYDMSYVELSSGDWMRGLCISSACRAAVWLGCIWRPRIAGALPESMPCSSQWIGYGSTMC